MLESAYIILQNRRSIPNLAEQWVIDCDTGNDGCRGGNIKKAIEFVSKTQGSIMKANTLIMKMQLYGEATAKRDIQPEI